MASAEEAVADGQPTFDLALIDTQDLDARACVTTIRAEAGARTPRFVLVSTIARGESALAKEGFDGSITKPVRQEDLFACVARVTGRSAVPMPPDADDTACRERTAVARARILVAEDNRVNREVVTTMLDSLGCQVEVVVDGAEAVEAVQRNTHDLIFLDCEMPNLDGYQTALEIRKLEDQHRVPSENTVRPSGRIPIVALTAHTSSSDRARGLENGMDDYVTKPLSLQKLRGVVARWVESRPESSEPASPATPPDSTGNTPDDAPISEAALEPILELDRLSGGSVFARVVKIFLQEAPDTLEDLQTAAHAGDAEGIAKAAHALKSASRNVGAESLATLCQELEALGRHGTSEGAEAMATRADALYLTVKTALEARLERDQRGVRLSRGPVPHVRSCSIGVCARPANVGSPPCG